MDKRNTRLVRDMSPGDLVICHQTDRREFVGVAEFVGLHPGTYGEELRLKPLHRFDPPRSVPDLKKADALVARIKALQPGPIQSIYELDRGEGEVLLDALGQQI